MSELRCTSRSKSTGKQCGNPPMKGAKTCRMHGSANRVSREAARRKLNELAMPSVAALQKSLDTALETGDYSLAVKCAIAVLDRTGFGPKSSVELTGEDGGPIQVENYIPLEALSLNTKMLVLKEVEEWRKKKELDN